MSRQWLTKEFLSKHSEDLGEYVPAQPSKIERVQNESSLHVNRLLSEDRVDYIVGSDNTLIKLVDGDKHAIPIKKRFIVFGDGSRKELTPSESILVTQDYVEYQGEQIDGARLEAISFIGLFSRKDMLDNKPSGEKDYYSFSLGDQKKYVFALDIEEFYSEAKVTTMSVMEVTALPKDKMNIRFLAQHFPHMQIGSKDFLMYINNLLQKAIMYLKVRAPILASHKEFKKISEMVFGNEQDIVHFLQFSQSENRRSSVAACTLTKFMFLLHKFQSHELFPFLDKIYKDDEFLFTYLRKIFNLPSSTKLEKDERGVVTFKKIFPEFNNTEVTVIARIKNLDSILQKSLADASYLELDDLKDILGVTIYIPESDKKFTYDILKQADLNLLGGVGYIKNKGLLKKEYLPPGAEEKYQKASVNTQRNTSSSENYEDVKVRGIHDIHIEYEEIQYAGKLGTEVKVVHGTPTNDSNENGMAFHLVFDYFGKHFEGEQNRNPFITAKNLSRLFDDFFEYLQKNIGKYPAKTLRGLLSEIDAELPKANEISYFPQNGSDIRELEHYYQTKMKLRMFLYFAKKFKFQRANFEKEIIFTTAYNREQLQVGGRGYKIQS